MNIFVDRSVPVQEHRPVTHQANRM
jgi:hypothetical protein